MKHRHRIAPGAFRTIFATITAGLLLLSAAEVAADQAGRDLPESALLALPAAVVTVGATSADIYWPR